MIDARPDLIAFAPSAALIPPSRIAVIYSVRSSTSPPNAFTTVPARGIASVISCRLVLVAFSAAFRKLIAFVISLVLRLNAVCRLSVVFIACWRSTSPSRARRVVSRTAASSFFPVKPTAATSAVSARVSSIATPNDDAISVASAVAFLRTASTSTLPPPSVSPYTFVIRTSSSSIFLNVIADTAPRAAIGIVIPTIIWRPAH